MAAIESRGTPQFLPTTSELRAAFEEEVAALGGAVADAFDDGARLYLRAVLPLDAEVRRGDRVRGGVALRVAGEGAPEVLVHPYTFRQVCSNGAIHSQALATRRVERVPRADVVAPAYDVAVALAGLRDAVQACAAREAFAGGVAEMRGAAEADADYVLMILPVLARMAGDEARHVLPHVLRRFERAPDPDRSAFGLMNAVTSVARDTRDPETRWRLEELGGAIAARVPRVPTRVPTAATAGAVALV
jgi:hypothetical protein